MLDTLQLQSLLIKLFKLYSGNEPEQLKVQFWIIECHSYYVYMYGNFLTSYH